MAARRTTDLLAKAQALLALHVPGNPGVFPTAWDAWSATLAADAGFAALTLGSHPVSRAAERNPGGGGA